MKKICAKISAAFLVAVFTIQSAVLTFAEEQAPKNMSKSFEKIFDYLFKDKLDDFFTKLSAEDKLRAKTAILVVLFAIVASFILITIFCLDRHKHPQLDEDDDEDVDEDELDDDED